MPPRPSGFDDRERHRLLERLRQNEETAQRHAKDLDIQFRRIADMQAQIDQLAAQLHEVIELTSEMRSRLETLTRYSRRIGLPPPLKAPLRRRNNG